jgi:hypothetical protein
MSETYNSAGSPYWCMKAFAMLAAPDDHPFWSGPEAEADQHTTITLPRAGMVVGADDGQAVALMAPAPGGWSFVEESDAKYQKLAYSSRFAFSGDFEQYGFLFVTDSMLAVTDPATGARGVRTGTRLAHVVDGIALSRWSPLPGVRVDTALWGGAPWHVRLHRIVTDRAISVSETGFALPWEPEDFGPGRPESADAGWVVAASEWGGSTIVDRSPFGGPRTGELRALSPNANLMHPHTVVPALEVSLPAGMYLLAAAVGASHDAAAVAFDRAPALPFDFLAQLDEFAARPEPPS